MSAGGPSAMQFAALHPERTTRLVLIVPAAFAPRPGGDTAMDHPREVPFLFDTALRSDFLFWALIHAAPDLTVRTILGTPTGIFSARPSRHCAAVRPPILVNALHLPPLNPYLCRNSSDR